MTHPDSSTVEHVIMMSCMTISQYATSSMMSVVLGLSKKSESFVKV
jgi:hypothetical protein